MRILSHITPPTSQRIPSSLKTLLALLLILFAICLPSSASAQGQNASLERLDVEFWPDYDRAAVLVLFTGSLTADTNLPVSISIPIPENAEINAVARVDAVGDLFTDINYDFNEPGMLLLNLTEPTFRIEFYFPYESNGNQREFSFQWLADIDVNQLNTTFQQPSIATNVVLSPLATNTIRGGDNLLYHQLPSEVVVAGTPYSVDASYEMVRQQLSSELIANEQAANVTATTQTEVSQTSDDFNWLLVLLVIGGVLILFAFGWLLYSNRRSNTRRIIKPKPIRRAQYQRTSTPGPRSIRPIGKSKYCHECGQPLDPTDKFCRNCGTPVKDS